MMKFESMSSFIHKTQTDLVPDVIYLHKIVAILNIPRNACGPDWTLSRTEFGPRTRLWGPLAYTVLV